MKNFKIAFALAMLTAGVSLSANEVASAAQKPQVVEAAALKLSVEEQAFAAKLSDQNRKAFTEKLTADQRKAAMAAAKVSTAANAANDAVAACVASDKKDVAVADAVKEIEAVKAK